MSLRYVKLSWRQTKQTRRVLVVLENSDSVGASWIHGSSIHRASTFTTECTKGDRDRLASTGPAQSRYVHA